MTMSPACLALCLLPLVMGVTLRSHDGSDDLSRKHVPGATWRVANYDSENADRTADVLFPGSSSPSMPGLIVVPEDGADKTHYRKLAQTAYKEWGFVVMVMNPANAHAVLRAVRYLRSRAEDFGVDQSRIAVLGFKNGGRKAIKAALEGSKKTAIQLAIVVDGAKSDGLVPLAHEGASPTLFLQTARDKKIPAIARALRAYDDVVVEISNKAGSKHENNVMKDFLDEHLGRTASPPETSSPPRTSTTTTSTTSAVSTGFGCKPCSGLNGDGCDLVEGELRLTQLDDDPVGFLKIFRDGSWQGMCGEVSDNMAKVACRQLGFSDGGAFVFNNDHEGLDDGPAFNPNFRCSGTEERLADCDSGPEEECVEGSRGQEPWEVRARLVCYGGCPGTEATPVNLCAGGAGAIPMACNDRQVINQVVGLSNVPESETSCEAKHFRNWFTITGTGGQMKFVICHQGSQLAAISLATCEGEVMTEEDCSDSYYAFDFYYECGVYGMGVVFNSEEGKEYLGGVGTATWAMDSTWFGGADTNSLIDPRDEFSHTVEVHCSARA
mmetsp:Transcript_22168/g.49034  ORF Transcript_22168/g.49034 Transcript_22168/m.49034 type:complete len:552 (+) Transcript_22168:79-1734(+)